MRPYVAVGAILLLGLVLAGCRSPFFQPLKDHADHPDLASRSREDVWFLAPDGVRLHGWFFRPSGRPRGTVLFLHGNSENISTHARATAWLVDEGYQVFAFDYRGYGKSEGSAELAGVHSDALAALELLFRLRGEDGGRVVVYGQSLGGSIAVYAVANSPRKDEVRALIVDGAFAGYRRIARDKLASHIISWPLQYPLAWLLDDSYAAERWIGSVSPVPVVVVHGTRDATVPYHHGERLYAAAREPKSFWVDVEGEHLSAMEFPDMRARLLSFLADALSVKTTAGP